MQLCVVGDKTLVPEFAPADKIVVTLMQIAAKNKGINLVLPENASYDDHIELLKKMYAIAVDSALSAAIAGLLAGKNVRYEGAAIGIVKDDPK